MKKSIDIITQLYAIKLSNYEVLRLFDINIIGLLNDVLKYGQTKFYKSDFYKIAYAKNMKYSTRYITRVFEGLNIKEYSINQGQQPLVIGLQKARKDGVINSNGDIIDMKKFIEIVLKKCKLPNYFLHCHNDLKYLSHYNVDFFHQLTNPGLAHIIQERIYHLFNEPFFEYSVYVNGVVQNEGLLETALADLHLLRYTNSQEIKNAVGTDGLYLCKTIVKRMFEHVK